MIGVKYVRFRFVLRNGFGVCAIRVCFGLGHGSDRTMEASYMPLSSDAITLVSVALYVLFLGLGVWAKNGILLLLSAFCALVAAFELASEPSIVWLVFLGLGLLSFGLSIGAFARRLGA